MSDKEFRELVEKRKAWLESSKANGFNFDSILSDLYADTSHFIFEILQNAEDADAASIDFKLSEDKLEITHDGNDFSFRDVDGITGIGISTKADDVNSIGKFGVGFKSVFKITQSPIIQSGQYCFAIDGYVLPRQLNHKEGNGTTIELPFEHEKNTQKEVFPMVEKKLQDIDLKTLLFLTNLKEIRWSTPTKSGTYSKSSKIVPGVHSTRRVAVDSQMCGDSGYGRVFSHKFPYRN